MKSQGAVFFVFIWIRFLLVPPSFAQEPEVVLTTGHTDQVNCMDISPDGKLLATGGNDNLLKLWDIKTSRELRTLAGNNGRLTDVQFSSNGKWIGGLNYNDQLRIWNVNDGKLINEFTASSVMDMFDFCLNDSAVVYIGDDGKIKISSVRSGDLIREIIPDAVFKCRAHPDSRRIFAFTVNGELVGYDISSGAEISRMKLPEEKMVPITRVVFNKKGNLLAVGFTDNSLRIFDVNEMKLVNTIKKHQTRIVDLCFEETGDYLISADHNHNIYVWDPFREKPVKHFEKTTFGITCLETHPAEKMLAYGEAKQVHYINFLTGDELYTFTAKGNKILSMTYDQQGRFLATAADDISIKLWDLQMLKIDKQISGFFPVEFRPDGKELVCMGPTLKLTVYDPVTGDVLRELDNENELIQNLDFSADGKFLAAAGFQGVIRIIDVTSGKQVKKLTGHAGGIYSTSFSPDGKYLASAGLDQSIRVWELSTGKEIKKMMEHQVLVHDIEFSPDGKILAAASWDKTVSIWNTEDWSLMRKLEGHVNIVNTLSFSQDSRLLATGAGNNVVAPADNSVRIWNVLSGETVCVLENPTGQINKVIFEKNGEFIFTCGEDGMAKIWNYKKCSPVAGLVCANTSDYIIITPDNYYTASKDALAAVSFRVDDQLFAFEQFDIRLNRPDIVASRIGMTPAGLINAFQYVYRKRLKKMDFREEDLGLNFHAPQVKLNTSSLPLVTEKDELKFSVFLEDKKYKLEKVLVYVNEVPAYGLAGLDLSDHNSQSMEKELSVNLIPGNNKIEVSCINEKGVVSLVEIFSVIRNSEGTASNLYIVSVGVSEYHDSIYNLNYAAKDAKDVMNRLVQSKDLYNEVHSLLLTDSNATKKNILNIRSFLNDADPDDIVIIFMAGHGVLDEKMDYYFATHDMDFNNPEAGGLLYDTLELILSEINAQRKLLMLDACHSGELDKEEMEINRNPVMEVKSVQFRSVGPEVTTKENFGFKNSLELMNQLFADVKRGSGTIVISSAGGAEYAMESDEWKNGLFTYCLLSAAGDYKADHNSDRHISVTELRNYTYEKVSRLSRGRQKPVTRTENLSLDYWVW